MDSLRNLLRLALAIDGHVSRSILVDNVYRLTICLVYCSNNRTLLPRFQLDGC